MFEPIYRRSNDSYVITFNNNPFHLVKDDADINYPGLWEKVMETSIRESGCSTE